jgi:hypothetical protein
MCGRNSIANLSAPDELAEFRWMMQSSDEIIAKAFKGA